MLIYIGQLWVIFYELIYGVQRVESAADRVRSGEAPSDNPPRGCLREHLNEVSTHLPELDLLQTYLKAVFRKVRIREIRMRKIMRSPYTDRDTRHFLIHCPGYSIRATVSGLRYPGYAEPILGLQKIFFHIFLTLFLQFFETFFYLYVFFETLPKGCRN